MAYALSNVIYSKMLFAHLSDHAECYYLTSAYVIACTSRAWGLVIPLLPLRVGLFGNLILRIEPCVVDNGPIANLLILASRNWPALFALYGAMLEVRARQAIFPLRGNGICNVVVNAERFL